MSRSETHRPDLSTAEYQRLLRLLFAPTPQTPAARQIGVSRVAGGPTGGRHEAPPLEASPRSAAARHDDGEVAA